MALTKATYSMINGVYVNINDYGADPTGANDSTTAIQAAIDAALASGQKVTGVGTYKISSKIVIKTDADFSQCTFNVYSTPAVAVEISTGSATDPTDYIINKVIWLPKRIENMTKPTTGWAGQGYGVRVVNAYSCEIFVGSVVNFSLGLFCLGNNDGNNYNNYYLGHLENNKINVKLQGLGTGWCNENNFFGGRLSHYSGEGTNVNGVVQITIEDSPNVCNNNIFYRPSLEGDVPQYHFACYGSVNTIVQGRWEAATPKILYASTNSNQGSENLIIGGYGVDAIIYNYSGTLGNAKNKTIGYGISYETTDFGTKYTNQNSNSSPIHTFYAAGTRPETAGATAWSMIHTSNYLQGKRTGDSYARVSVDYQNGLIGFGDGTANPLQKFYGNSGYTITSATTGFIPAADNAMKLGESSYRWSTVYAATGTINTSDEREKTEFKDLSELERQVAISIKSLLKSFKFKDAVSKKGDKARIHFGVSAQQVAEAFKIVGLNPDNYALFCYDEWEAKPAELNEEGEEITPALAAGNRYGIRYDELLAFIIGAL